MNEYAMGISVGKYKEHYFPNSLCIHLIIETLDNKIIKSRICMNKNNDNPGTWTVKSPHWCQALLNFHYCENYF